jgi:hypothetical protein
MTTAPGLLNGIMFRLFVRPVASVEPAPIEHRVEDGQKLPIADGLMATAGRSWQVQTEVGHAVLFSILPASLKVVANSECAGNQAGVRKPPGSQPFR